MIRGGGDPNTAMALKPCPEWARCLGASPQKRMVASWSGSCMDPTEYKVAARSIAPERGLPSDQLYRTSNNEGHRVAVTLDTKVLIQGCVKTPMPNFRVEFPSRFRSSRNQIALAASVGSRQLRKKFWGAQARARFHTAWVKSGSGGISRTCPLFPQQRTSLVAGSTSEMCQQQA